MAMLKDTLVATAPIASPADKFFDLFKNNMSEIVNIFPASFKSAQLIEGVEGTVGCVKIWTYVLGKMITFIDFFLMNKMCILFN